MKSESKPLISVIIPVFNGSKYIVKTLQAVLRQTLEPHEIIIVNDGSTDDTAILITNALENEPLRSKVKLIHQSNRGLSSARNAGISVASGDWIALIDADDLWNPNKLEEQAKLAKSRPNATIIYALIEFINDQDQVILQKIDCRTGFRKGAKTLMLNGNLITGSASSVLIKTSALKSALFDEKLVSCEDWDLWIRLAKENEFDFIDAKLVQIRRHSENMSTNKEKMLIGHLQVYTKHSHDLNILEKFLFLRRVIKLTSFASIARSPLKVFKHLKPSGLGSVALFLTLIPVSFFRNVLYKLNSLQKKMFNAR